MNWTERKKSIILTLMKKFLNKTRLDRRLFMGTIGAYFTLGQSGFAMTAGHAERLVKTVVAEINKVIESGKSDALMIHDFEKIFNAYSDVDTMARYALGRDGKKASPAEVKRFTRVFKSYIAKKYGSRFREFIGGKIEVKSARKVKKFFEVKTNVVLKNQGDFEVIFLVSDRSGSPLFFNVFVEGLNLLLTERSAIGAILDRNKGSIDALIRDLETAA